MLIHHFVETQRENSVDIFHSDDFNGKDFKVDDNWNTGMIQ